MNSNNMNSNNQYFPMHSLLENAMDKVLTVQLRVPVYQHDYSAFNMDGYVKSQLLKSLTEEMGKTLKVTKRYNPSSTPDPHLADYQYQAQAVVLTVEEYKQLLSLAGYSASNTIWEGLK